jgi:NADH-quinone oxidoreductase subunit L
MEGPTPVSALIHAATMVTAGVYMIGRNAVLFSHAPLTLKIVAIVGAATALLAGTIGLVQNDIKRVLAYSTVSQLGYMFLAMGVGAYASGIFHLYTHAFFKALLFLGSGAVIHALSGEQDMRKMGGLRKHLPITYWTFVIGSLAIAGFPGLAGFFSKDEILYRTYASGHTMLWAIGLLTALLTATYMFRLVFMTFHGPSHFASAPQAASPSHASGENPSNHSNLSNPSDHRHDAPPAMALALIVLAIGSVAAGWVGIGGRFEHFLEPSFGTAVSEVAVEGGPETTLMMVSVVVALAGIGMAAYFFLANRPASDRIAEQFSGVHRVLSNKYYVDEIYDAAVVQPIHIISEDGLWKGVDAGVIDRAVNGVGRAVGGSGEVLRRVQTGSVRTYAASLFFGVVLILGYYLWR